MVVPLVFLILPVTILFAVFRGSSFCRWGSNTGASTRHLALQLSGYGTWSISCSAILP